MPSRAAPSGVPVIFLHGGHRLVALVRAGAPAAAANHSCAGRDRSAATAIRARPATGLPLRGHVRGRARVHGCDGPAVGDHRRSLDGVARRAAAGRGSPVPGRGPGADGRVRVDDGQPRHPGRTTSPRSRTCRTRSPRRSRERSRSARWRTRWRRRSSIRSCRRVSRCRRTSGRPHSRGSSTTPCPCADLGAFKAPTLLLWGERDAYTSRAGPGWPPRGDSGGARWSRTRTPVTPCTGSSHSGWPPTWSRSCTRSADLITTWSGLRASCSGSPTRRSGSRRRAGRAATPGRRTPRCRACCCRTCRAAANRCAMPSCRLTTAITPPATPLLAGTPTR